MTNQKNNINKNFKELIFNDYQEDNDTCSIAQTPIGCYNIWRDNKFNKFTIEDTVTGTDFDLYITLEEAKEACQKHFSETLGSLLNEKKEENTHRIKFRPSHSVFKLVLKPKDETKTDEEIISDFQDCMFDFVEDLESKNSFFLTSTSMSEYKQIFCDLFVRISYNSMSSNRQYCFDAASVLFRNFSSHFYIWRHGMEKYTGPDELNFSDL